MKKHSETYFIKNMVCPRCVRVVREDLTMAGLPVANVGIGEVTLSRPVSRTEWERMKGILNKSGFELLSSREERLVEQVKHLITDHVWERQVKPESLNFSDYLARETHASYPTLSRLFSTLTSSSIEQFIIQQKIERVKELLTYGEETLTGIAYRMGYSSPQHLSAQFRKVTGLTPSSFRRNIIDRRTRMAENQK